MFTVFSSVEWLGTCTDIVPGQLTLLSLTMEKGGEKEEEEDGILPWRHVNTYRLHGTDRENLAQRFDSQW